MRNNRNVRGIVAAAGAVAAGLMLIAIPHAANATEDLNSATGTHQASQLSWVCKVNADNVIYRSEPDGIPLGQVHRGQGFDWIDSRQPPNGHMWYHGNLWGGRSNVWIRSDFLWC
jgi:hypothetical protein